MSRILVIDDEVSISKLIREVLMGHGHNVKTAANGREGLRLLSEFKFDLIVTDMCMPDINGSSIVSYVRNSNRHRTPIIGISGTPWMLEGVECDEVLAKPFSLKLLVETVRRLTKEYMKERAMAVTPNSSVYPQRSVPKPRCKRFPQAR